VGGPQSEHNSYNRINVSDHGIGGFIENYSEGGLILGVYGPYGAGSKQRLANLHIEGRGTIDWRGGEVGLANILWIDELTSGSTSDRLFIRNWYEYEDLFLVKKVHNGKEFDKHLLNQIYSFGYQPIPNSPPPAQP